MAQMALNRNQANHPLPMAECRNHVPQLKRSRTEQRKLQRNFTLIPLVPAKTKKNASRLRTMSVTKTPCKIKSGKEESAGWPLASDTRKPSSRCCWANPARTSTRSTKSCRTRYGMQEIQKQVRILGRRQLLGRPRNAK